MKKVPSAVVKKRSRELTAVFESFSPYNGMEGQVERVWITEVAADGIHLVGHTKGYIQVLVAAPVSLLGASAIVKITSIGRWSVFGQVIEILSQKSEDISNRRGTTLVTASSPCEFDPSGCSKEPNSCGCVQSCDSMQGKEMEKFMQPEDSGSKNIIGWLLRKRKNLCQNSGMENAVSFESKAIEEQILAGGSTSLSIYFDKALIIGILLSSLMIVALLVQLGIKGA